MTGMGAAEAVQSRWRLSLPWWSVVISALTTVLLAGLAFALLAVHALTYGFTHVLGVGSVDDPDIGRYELGLAVGIGINVVGGAVVRQRSLRSRGHRPPCPSWTGFSSDPLPAEDLAIALLLVEARRLERR